MGGTKGIMSFKKILQLLSFSCLLLLSHTEAMALSFSIDPLRTFLFTHNDPWSGNGSVALSIPIVLGDVGISGGDLIQLDQLGDYYDGYAGYGVGVNVPALDVFTEMIGVFSNSSMLLEPDVLHRVPGAMDAGIGVLSWNTLYGDMTTNIPEDFRVANTILQVPLGATHLFIATHDIYYSDNSDPDGDYGVRITQLASAPSGVVSVPEPATVLMFGLGLAVFIGWHQCSGRLKRSVS